MKCRTMLKVILDAPGQAASKIEGRPLTSQHAVHQNRINQRIITVALGLKLRKQPRSCNFNEDKNENNRPALEFVDSHKAQLCALM